MLLRQMAMSSTKLSYHNWAVAMILSFWVMNRWGEVIFYSNDINVGWDGTYNKQRCPLGVYSWKARYNGAKTNQIKLGEVHLMN